MNGGAPHTDTRTKRLAEQAKSTTAIAPPVVTQQTTTTTTTKKKHKLTVYYVRIRTT